MSDGSYYEILGVERSADSKEIKKAYRKLAMQHHPDRNPGDPSAEEKFKKITEAYNVLSDPEKKSHYDTHGSENSGPRAQHRQAAADIFSHFGDIFADDIFGDMFGRRRRSRGPRPGEDINIDLRLSFMEAALGCEKTINIQKPTRCEKCAGLGAEPGTGHKVCNGCGGHGAVRIKQGMMVMQTPCRTCGGTGNVPEKACDKCNGSGQDPIVDTIKLKVPSGMDTGQKLRATGKGLDGDPGAPSGDVYIRIFVDHSESFQRDGLDIHTQEMLSFKQACLGCDIEINTIHGSIKFRTPPGTQPGDACVIEGAGIVHRSGDNMGSHIVHINVSVPKSLSEEQKEMVRNLTF